MKNILTDDCVLDIFDGMQGFIPYCLLKTLFAQIESESLL